MRAMRACTSTDTANFSMQPGLGHSMQRSDSCRACSAGKPRFTSRKLCARTCASCSGTRWRGSLVRSLLGSGLWLVLACVGLLIGHPHCVQSALRLVILPAKPLQLGLRISLQPIDALPLLLAIHTVALHQHFEVDALRIELGTVDAGKLA